MFQEVQDFKEIKDSLPYFLRFLKILKILLIKRNHGNETTYPNCLVSDFQPAGNYLLCGI
jgi:hypothetical protein